MAKRRCTDDGERATRDELTCSDWADRLALAAKESKEGAGITLEAYIKGRRMLAR